MVHRVDSEVGEALPSQPKQRVTSSLELRLGTLELLPSSMDGLCLDAKLVGGLLESRGAEPRKLDAFEVGAEKLDKPLNAPGHEFVRVGGVISALRGSARLGGA